LRKNINYFKALSWFLFSLLVSSCNDIIAKKLGQNISGFEIVTLRFFFSTVILLPFMFYAGRAGFKTKHLGVHAARGFILFAAIAIWCICLKSVPVVMVTLLSFSIPLFFIILAYFFLNEKIGPQRLAITIIGFVGILIVINPTQMNFNPITLTLVIAVILFAGLDVLNKKYISQESTVNMLFYSSLFTTLFSLAPTIYAGWVSPNLHDLILCIILGAGANLILYALLKAFTLADATALSPLRYSELIFSAGLGYLFFNELPNNSIYLGAAIIIPCNLYLIYSESKS
jgi:S-adenosylmethionine uptake transporter